MATGSISGTLNLSSPKSIGITVSSSEYPNGSFSISGGTFYCTRGLSTNVHYYFNLYLCDSAGGNKKLIKQIDIVGNASGYGTASAAISSTISGATNLTGKALYIVAEFDHISEGSYSYGAAYFEIRTNGAATVTVSTANAYGASTGSASNIEFGNTSTVSITINSSASVYHVVNWVLGGHSGTQTTATGGRTASLLIPESWMDDTVQNATSEVMEITIQTRKTDGSVIGTTSTSCTVSVPSSVKPSISSVSVVIANQGASSSFASKYIQNLTGATITINASGAHGSTISNYSLSVSPTETTTKNGNVYSISKIKNSGTITFTATVTDSRGRTASRSATISVSAYRVPNFTNVSAFRCNSSGTADENGTYARISETIDYMSSVGGTSNSCTVNSVYYNTATPSSTTTAVNNMSSGTGYTIGNGSLSINNTYEVKFTATDTVGSTVVATAIVQTSPYAIHVKNGGNGVAFGKVSSRSNAVDINEGWDFYYKGKKMFEFVYATSSLPSTGLHEGLVCFKKK